MKSTLITVVIFTTILIFAGFSNSQLTATDFSQQSEAVSASDTLEFTVYGMDCPGCEGGLEKQVNKIPSVASSDANWVKQKLEIVLKKDSTLNLEQLKERVKKANFTLSTDPLKDEDEK